MALVNWKKERNLKISGSVIKQGVFRGWKSATKDGLKAHDIPTKFTPEYIDKLYSGINGHIPVVVDHQGSGSTVVGYTYQAGITPNKDDIQIRGFVFDESAEQKIIREGYTFVSPEIVEETDAFGNVTPRLLRISLVKNPAIEGTDLSIEPIVFSKGEEDMTDGQDAPPAAGAQQTEDQKKEESFGRAKQDSQKLDITFKMDKTKDDATPSPKVGNDVALEVAELKAQNAVMQKQLDKMLTERYDGIVAELARHGIEDPGKIVNGLSTDQKIAVLSKMLGTVVKQKPVAEAGDAPPDAGGAKKDTPEAISAAVAEVLESCGYTLEEYKELRGEK
jgi:hypothetical protein